MQYLSLTFQECVYAISSSEGSKKPNQSVHTHYISEKFQSGIRKKGLKLPQK